MTELTFLASHHIDNAISPSGTHLGNLQPDGYTRQYDLWRPERGLAPHDWLPVEIMQRIFGLYAKSHGTVNIPFGGANVPPQLVVCHVCSAWRHIALGSGALWSDVVISTLNPKTLGVVESWLRRARNIAVVVKISLIKTTFHDLAYIFKTLFSPLRIKLLDIMLTSIQLVQLSALSSCDIPHIEETRVVLHGHKYTPAVPPQSFLARTQYLLCASGPCPELLHSGCFPMSHLRHLDLQCVEISPSQCFTILRQATSLEACRFLWYWEWDGNQSLEQREDLILPNMKILSIEFHRQRQESIVFSAITRYLVFPNLRKLSIRYRGLTAEIISAIAGRFNFARLEELELRKTCFMAAEDLLAYTPLLRRATLSKNIIVDEETMDALSSGKIGPLVESIKTNFPCDARGVFRMIEARMDKSVSPDQYGTSGGQVIRPLRYVNFRSPVGIEEYTEDINTLEGKGVHVIMNDYANRRKLDSPQTGESETSDIWTKFVRSLHT